MFTVCELKFILCGLINLSEINEVFSQGHHQTTGRIRIQCQAIVDLISGQDYYEFGVKEIQQSGLIWSRL